MVTGTVSRNHLSVTSLFVSFLERTLFFCFSFLTLRGIPCLGFQMLFPVSPKLSVTK